MQSPPATLIVITSETTPCEPIQELIDTGCYQPIDSIPSSTDNQHYLTYQNSALTLSINIDGATLSLSHDYSAGKSNHRRLYGGGKNQPLTKACGLNKHPTWTIFDATAGLGRDAFVLASLGAQITLCEQNAVLYGLLADAIQRGLHEEVTQDMVKNMYCLHRNAIHYLAELHREADKQCPDVIYLDPMYPDRKKSAKIKKEMQILQQLVGHSGDEEKLFEEALKTAKHRVVVKRPKTAEPIKNKPASYTVSSVNTRYDVYVVDN